MQITGLLLKAKIGRYLMRNGGGLDANIQYGETLLSPSSIYMAPAASRISQNEQ